MFKYFTSNNLLSEKQFGSRPKHTIEHETLKLYDYLLHQLDSSNISVSISTDLSKPFDTIDHEILVKKIKLYGFDDVASGLLKSYLTNRKQFVYCKYQI